MSATTATSATTAMTPATSISWSDRTPRRRPRATDAVVTLTGLAIAMLASLASIGCDRPSPRPTTILTPSPNQAPSHPPVVVSSRSHSLCVTDGDVVPSGDRATVREPSTRGYLAGSTGDSASLAFTYRGRSQSVAALASGTTREQLGLKLRAQDSCNVVYVMWRIEPKSELVVQMKRNAAREHRECGNAGYTGVRPSFRGQLPALGVPEWPTRGDGPTTKLDHELRASIVDDELEVFADDKLVWRGTLPPTARDLHGPAGFRTDNVDLDLALRAPVTGASISCPPRKASQVTASRSPS
jgi:hypothetical protein